MVQEDQTERRSDDGVPAFAGGEPMTLKTSRVLLAVASVAVLSIAPMTGAAGKTTTGSPGQTQRVRTPDENGVIGRKVGEVVAERREGRRLASMDPKAIHLADDPNAYFDENEKVFYADHGMDVAAAPGSTVSPAVAEGAAPATGSAFALHSRPGSTHTIYLDFDGETVANTAWNQGRVNPKTVPPYDVDGIPGSFNTTEEQTVRNVWQAVAEDWAPFDVNVTTQRPASNDAFIRSSIGDNVFGSIAIITPDRWTCSTCGGVAYVDIHDGTAPGMYYQYAWVFPSPGWSSSSIANVISHEVGHNFGLSHDGLDTAAYYGGTGSWGPIMGNPNRSYVQWSKGEYSGATNAEDDLAIIGGTVGSFTDSSSSTSAAVQIPNAGLTQTSADDVINSGTDQDFHALDVTNGYLRATFTRSPYSNLYARISLLNSTGGEVSTAGLFTGSSTTLHSGPLANGRYYLKTEPVGDTSSPGFTTYGSLGFFSWTVTRADAPAMVSATLTPLGDRTFVASWSATSAATLPYTYTYSLCTTTSCGAAVATASASAVLTAPTPTGSYFVKVTASNQYGLASPELTSALASVRSKPIAPTVSKLRWDETADTLEVEWGNGQEFAPVTITGHTISARNRTTGASVSASVSGMSGATPLAIPGTWDGSWVDVSIVSSTSSPSPWDVSNPSLSDMLLGRTAPPSATGSNSARNGAQPAQGSQNTRTGAPAA